MANELCFDPEVYHRAMSHLLKNDTEQVTFAFADVTVGDDRLVFRATDLYLAQPSDFQLQSSYHVSLTDECLGRVIKMAWDKNAVLVDIHSHLSASYPAQFSSSDLYGFREWVPHIWWRLNHKPVLAVVVSPSTFDALVWRVSPSQPEELSEIRVGDETKKPTNLTIRELEKQIGQPEV